MAGDCMHTRRPLHPDPKMMSHFESNSGALFLSCWIDFMKAAMKSWGFPGTRQGEDTSVYGRRGMAKRKETLCIACWMDLYIGGCQHGNDGSYR
jgi:hypothetical protein